MGLLVLRSGTSGLTAYVWSIETVDNLTDFSLPIVLKMIQRFVLTTILLSTIGLYPTIAHAETWVELGDASTGELVMLDRDSVRVQRGIENFEFRYQIGADTVAASVNCPTRKVYPDGYKAFIPNPGTTTDRMVDRVCEIGRQLLKPKPQKKPQLTTISLQPGVYRVASRYIQIAKQGDRLCYQGTGRGRTIASVSPHPTIQGLYRIDGWEDAILQQERSDTLAFGSEKLRQPYPIDATITPEIDADLQACLDSTTVYHQQFPPGRSGR
jgi:hypothetical protein